MAELVNMSRPTVV